MRPHANMTMSLPFGIFFPLSVVSVPSVVQNLFFYHGDHGGHGEEGHAERKAFCAIRLRVLVSLKAESLSYSRGKYLRTNEQ